MYTGICNQCGKCCTYTDPNTGDEYRCDNLEVIKPLGQPEASRCLVHKEKWVGKPITMRSVRFPIASYPSKCLASYPRNEDAIPPECSFVWDNNGKQPRWHPGYTPNLIQIRL